MERRKSRLPAAVGFAALLLGGAPLAAPPPLRLVEREQALLRIRPLTAALVNTEEQDRERSLAVAAGRDGQLALDVRWPDARSTSHIELRGALLSEPSEPEHRIRLDAEVTLPGGATVRSQRVLVFKESTTAFFELLRDAERPLVLVVEAELARESNLEPRQSVGLPVQLGLQIERVVGGKSVPLETNRLDTFVGESVSYSFRHGEAGRVESVQIQLTPLAIHGDLARLEIELSGTLPDGERPLWLSRKEQWLSSRGTTSSVEASTGQPPNGYRFLITPRF